MDPDATIPAVDGDDAARQLQAARADTLVLLSPNTWLPGPEAEAEAITWANGGISTHVIGWRRARPGEMRPGYRAAWNGDLDKLDGTGLPWWWQARAVAGVGNLAQHGADFEAYLDAHRRGAEAAARAAG